MPLLLRELVAPYFIQFCEKEMKPFFTKAEDIGVSQISKHSDTFSNYVL